MLDNEQLCSGTTLVYCRACNMYDVPQQASYLSVNDSQESPMNKRVAIASLSLEDLHSDSSNSMPSGNRSSRRLREFIPEHKKDTDYWIKRQKNNEAAKRSREKRRLNDVIMGERIIELSNENKRLRMELDAIRRTYGSPPPPQPPPQPSVEMPYSITDVSYCIGGNSYPRRSSMPSPGSVVVVSNATTSFSCSSFSAHSMPVEPRCMPSSCDLQPFAETLPGGLGKSLFFEERKEWIRSLSGPTRSTCMLYSFEDERLRQKQMEAVVPEGYGNESYSRAYSLAYPTSHISSARDGVVVLSALDNRTSHARTAGNQINGSMPLLVRHADCFQQTAMSESHSEMGMRQENATSGQRTLPDQTSGRHQVELPLLFSDVSSDDENDNDILSDLYQLRSLDERPLNLSTRSGSSPVSNGQQALLVNRMNTGLISEFQGTTASKAGALRVLDNLEQVTSAFNLPTSFSHHNCNRNVLESLSKVDLQLPEVPYLGSSHLLLSKNEVTEKQRLPEMLTRELSSTASFADSFLGGHSCLLKLSSQQNRDAPVHESDVEEETECVSVPGEQVISDTELYTFLQSDLMETPMKAEKDTGGILSRPMRGVPLKVWHKWSSVLSEKFDMEIEGREHDPYVADGPIRFQE